ncbi:thioesterase family protein [Aciditerrimonas ferrireducens]|uniref:thioesterase family protein n=1 Tax=Aciditerrimonas ferrireducens TaxID=667306 RepID=UPI002002A5FD|nr:hotdog domain-containing protein [Aciditerrimonas ferrireducens]MCK4176552.1 hypothetical protein [Aciditerrimonas ferrireducens]
MQDTDTALALGTGVVPVLATPRLVALCEQAACNAVHPLLPAGRTTVGSRLQFDHLAPVKVGSTVRAEATPASWGPAGSPGSWSTWNPSWPRPAEPPSGQADAASWPGPRGSLGSAVPARCPRAPGAVEGRGPRPTVTRCSACCSTRSTNPPTCAG